MLPQRTQRKEFTTETLSAQSSAYSLIKYYLLRVLGASTLKIVADPSCGGSAVRYFPVMLAEVKRDDNSQ
jgi:hypothetical protein